LVLSWSGFRHTDRFRGNGHMLRIFLFSKAHKCKTSMARVPYNKLLTNLASSSRTGEYWPSVVFVRTSLRSVRTATTSGQNSPVRPSRSVIKRLLFFSIFHVYSSLTRLFNDIFAALSYLSVWFSSISGEFVRAMVRILPKY